MPHITQFKMAEFKNTELILLSINLGCCSLKQWDPNQIILQFKELRDLLEETNNFLVAPEKHIAANHSKL